MNDLTVFENPEFGPIRTVELDGEPWLVGKDVATALGYKNPQEAIRTHVDDEDKGVSEILTPGGKQSVPIINESGLYSLVLSSKLPTARKFRRWVTSEVLPSIRRTGGYTTQKQSIPTGGWRSWKRTPKPACWPPSSNTHSSRPTSETPQKSPRSTRRWR